MKTALQIALGIVLAILALIGIGSVIAYEVERTIDARLQRAIGTSGVAPTAKGELL